MENESSTTQQKVGLSTRARNWILALPGRFWAKIIAVMENIKKLGKDDPRRVIHSLKVGFALTLVSLLYYVRPLYDGFGVSGMWAVLTVVVVFEFSVGATLSKSLNRGLATLLAGALGVGAEHLASLSGDKGKPILLGILVFLLGAASTFSRFYPKIKARYDYGVLIFILTFSLVAVSGYRVDELMELAHQRLSTILIGGATCIVIAIFVCPVWAGEDLHKLVASNIEKLAAYLEGFGSQYFQVSEGEEGSKKDKSFSLGYKSVLASKNTEDTLANFARWEPGHGRFRLRHPWKLYLKIGGLARQCAYQIEALNGYINSTNVKVPPEFKVKIQESCTKMSVESSKALKALATSIKTMSDPSPANSHLEISKNAVNDIQSALQDASVPNAINNIADLQAIVPAATVAAILMEIVKCVEKITESVNELSNVAHFKKKVEATVSPETGKHLLHRGTVNPVFNSTDGGSSDHVVITIHEISDDVVATAPDSGQPRPRVQV